MSDDHNDDQAAPPPREKPHWKMKPHEKLEWMRREREKHRPVREPVIEVDDNAARDDEYDPYAR